AHALHVLREPGGAAQAQDEDAGREGVEGAGVADLGLAAEPSQGAIDRVARGDPGRFVEYQKAVESRVHGPSLLSSLAVQYRSDGGKMVRGGQSFDAGDSSNEVQSQAMSDNT